MEVTISEVSGNPRPRNSSVSNFMIKSDDHRRLLKTVLKASPVSSSVASGSQNTVTPMDLAGPSRNFLAFDDDEDPSIT